MAAKRRMLPRFERRLVSAATRCHMWAWLTLLRFVQSHGAAAVQPDINPIVP
jgi:hypothetical protein